jgi:hydrogenase maturation protease
VLVVGCAPASLDEGIGLSAAVEGAVDRAVDAIEDLLGDLCAPIARADAKETCP